VFLRNLVDIVFNSSDLESDVELAGTIGPVPNQDELKTRKRKHESKHKKKSKHKKHHKKWVKCCTDRFVY